MIVVKVLIAVCMLPVGVVLLLAAYWTLRDVYRSWRHPGYLPLAPVVRLDEWRRRS